MSQLNALHNVSRVIFFCRTQYMDFPSFPSWAVLRAVALLSTDQTLQRTIAKMDKMREEYETQLGYELYQ
eukprot:scaffold173371_cov26-Prasinocladus_malaysianus.AAC.1